MAQFTVKLPDFEGPLDLLLFFIKRDELNIYDIPIAHITREFLSTVQMMQMLDLELAGEFIVMAATLLQIKARMLLPHPSSPDEQDTGPDPREELMKRLLEYKRYKEAARGLQTFEEEQRRRFPRTCFRFDVRTCPAAEGEESLRDVTLFDLITAFKKAIQSMPEITTHEVTTIPWTVEEQAVFLMDFFAGRDAYHFLEIVGEMENKMQMVVTFVALLELIRSRRVRVRTRKGFNDFLILRRTDD
ncbi:MAG: segregation/condensation protein A [Bacteroidota bacterium]|nr:segregation/condensation protein A [Bacteroidota bacterium]